MKQTCLALVLVVCLIGSTAFAQTAYPPNYCNPSHPGFQRNHQSWLSAITPDPEFMWFGWWSVYAPNPETGLAWQTPYDNTTANDPSDWILYELYPPGQYASYQYIYYNLRTCSFNTIQLDPRPLDYTGTSPDYWVVVEQAAVIMGETTPTTDLILNPPTYLHHYTTPVPLIYPSELSDPTYRTISRPTGNNAAFVSVTSSTNDLFMTFQWEVRPDGENRFFQSNYVGLPDATPFPPVEMSYANLNLPVSSATECLKLYQNGGVDCTQPDPLFGTPVCLCSGSL